LSRVEFSLANINYIIDFLSDGI